MCIQFLETFWQNKHIIIDSTCIAPFHSFSRSMGLLIGSLSVLVCQPGTQSMRRILTATPAIGHANSIPFLLVGLIVTQAGEPGGEPVFFFGKGMKIFWVVKLQIFFMFIPNPGEMIQFDSYFSDELKPPTSFSEKV